MRPERVAAELDARTPGWAILFGRYSGQLVALHLNGPGVVAASSVAELQRRMALVESAAPARRARHLPRHAARHGPDGAWAPPRPAAAPPGDSVRGPGNGYR